MKMPDRLWMYLWVWTALRLLLCLGQDDTEIVDLTTTCSAETFHAECGADEIIVLDVALYGRMRMSRCVLVDFGFIGCYADVLGEADTRCSGRRSCDIRIPDAMFDDTQNCMGDLVRYFETQYHCQTVVSASREDCQSSFSTHAPGPSGFLASLTTQETGCGARYRPWLIEVAPTQRINLTLYDFSVLDASIASILPCPEYVVVREDASGEATRVCGGEERVKQVYLSRTNKIQLEMTLAHTQPGVAFAVKYEAIGCAEPPLPAGATLRSFDDYVMINCGSSSTEWRLDCKGSVWHGTMGNCTAPALARSTEHGNVLSGLVTSIPNGYAIAIIIAIAVVISAVILVIGLFYLSRRNSSRASATRTQALKDKDVYYAKCNVELDNTIHRQSFSRQVSRDSDRYPAAVNPNMKSDPHLNDYGYGASISPHWPPNSPGIPTYDGADRAPVEHIYESPIFSRRQVPQYDPTRQVPQHDPTRQIPQHDPAPYFELDPEQIPHPPHIHGIHPGSLINNQTDYWK